MKVVFVAHLKEPRSLDLEGYYLISIANVELNPMKESKWVMVGFTEVETPGTRSEFGDMVVRIRSELIKHLDAHNVVIMALQEAKV